MTAVLDFPIARICRQYAAGKITFIQARRELRPWTPDEGHAEAWLIAAKQPAAPGFGSWHTRRNDPEIIAPRRPAAKPAGGVV